MEQLHRIYNQEKFDYEVGRNHVVAIYHGVAPVKNKERFRVVFDDNLFVDINPKDIVGVEV